MPFNKNISGVHNEIEFVKYLNGKKVQDVHPLWRDLLFDLYPTIRPHYSIMCWKNPRREKTDIMIRINGITKNISIKKGVKNSVHVESISSFMALLNKFHISKKSYFAYLRYHFADGTCNGTGSVRASSEEYKEKHQAEIDALNQEWNTDKILNAITERFLLGNGEKQKVDVLIYGVIDDFIWVTKEDIRKIILQKKDTYSSGPHFGPLSCQPMNRCLNRNPKYERNRFFVQIKWYNLADDIIENMNQKIQKHRAIRSLETL